MKSLILFAVTIAAFVYVQFVRVHPEGYTYEFWDGVLQGFTVSISILAYILDSFLTYLGVSLFGKGVVVYAVNNTGAYTFGFILGICLSVYGGYRSKSSKKDD